MSKEIIFNGILCSHDTPVKDFETNDRVLFLHNQTYCLGEEVKKVADYKKISFCYFISDTEQTIEKAKENLMKQAIGVTSVEIESSGYPYSDVTPDLCWSHENEFKIGGHDMNRELSGYVGKWIIIVINQMEDA